MEPRIQADRPMILVVEPDESIRTLIVTITHRLGLEADAAAGAEEAIEKLQTREYQAIVIEPEMPAWESLLQFIAIARDGHRPRLIAVTVGDGSNAIRSGARFEAVLRKPFALESLASVVLESCERDGDER